MAVGAGLPFGVSAAPNPRQTQETLLIRSLSYRNDEMREILEIGVEFGGHL